MDYRYKVIPLILVLSIGCPLLYLLLVRFNAPLYFWLVSIAANMALIYGAFMILRSLAKEGSMDFLTQMDNRRSFTKKINLYVCRAKQLGQPLSILVIDVDDFKVLNDTYGHLVGDKILVELATVLKSCLRKSDFAARWGGEEFCVVLPGTDETGARMVADRISRNVANMPSPSDNKITVSIGIATLKGPFESPDDLFRRADEALYALKKKNGSRNHAAQREINSTNAL